MQTDTTTPNIVAPTMLRVVASVLQWCANGATPPNIRPTCNIQQCFVLLHEALLTIGRRRRQQRERQKSNRLDKPKTTTLHVHHDFLAHFSVEYVNTRQKLSFSFPELRFTLLEFNSGKICQHVRNWTRRNMRD